MPQDNLDLDFLQRQKQKLAGEIRDHDSEDAETGRVLRLPEPMPDADLILGDFDNSTLGLRVIEVDEDDEELDDLAELDNEEFDIDTEFSIDADFNLDEAPLSLPADPEPASEVHDVSPLPAEQEQDGPDAEPSDESKVHLVLDSETEDEIRILVEDLDEDIVSVFSDEEEEHSGPQVAESDGEGETANAKGLDFNFDEPADLEKKQYRERPHETDAEQEGQPRPWPPHEPQQDSVDAPAFKVRPSNPTPLKEQALADDEATESPFLDPSVLRQTERARDKNQAQSRQSRSWRSGFSEPKPRADTEPTDTARGKPAFSFASLFENSRLLGIDLGSSSVKYVELERGARGLNLVNCGNFVLPEAEKGKDQTTGADQTAAVVAERLNLKQFKDDLVTSAISGVIFKNIKVPRMSRKELRKAVPSACRKDLPFPPEKTVFEFRTLNGAKAEDGKLAVYVIAAQKELLRHHLRQLEAARITPAKIATIPSALWHLFRACVGRNLNGCHCVVDIGAGSSHIVFINRGELQFAREISTAGHDFTQALTGALVVDGKEIKLSAEQAESLKRNYGIPGEMNQFDIVDGVPLIEVSARVGEVLERLTNDIQRTMDFYKERFKAGPVTKVYLTGGGALMPNLPGKLSRELQAEVTVLNPFDVISLRKFDNSDELRKSGPKFAVAVGLALDKQKSLNFLPPDLKRSNAARYAKKIFRYVMAIALLAMIFLSQDIARKVRRVRGELRRVTVEYQRNAPNRLRFEKLQRDLKVLEQLKSQQGPVHKVDFSAAHYLKLVSQIFPAHMTLTSLRYTRQQRHSAGAAEATAIPILILDGVAFPNRSLEGMNLANFLLALKKSAEFQSVSLVSQAGLENGGLRFTIECEAAP